MIETGRTPVDLDLKGSKDSERISMYQALRSVKGQSSVILDLLGCGDHSCPTLGTPSYLENYCVEVASARSNSQSSLFSNKQDHIGCDEGLHALEK